MIHWLQHSLLKKKIITIVLWIPPSRAIFPRLINHLEKSPIELYVSYSISYYFRCWHMKNSLGLKRLKFSYNTNHSEYHKKKSILNNNLWPSKKYEPNRYLFGKALLCMNNLYCTLGGQNNITSGNFLHCLAFHVGLLILVCLNFM